MNKIIFFICIIITAFSVSSWAQEIDQIFYNVSPAVVTISSTQMEFSLVHPDGYVNTYDNGSGFLISKNQVITSAHIVQTADKIMVGFEDGENIEAKVMASAPMSDLALLELNEPRQNIIPIKLGNSDNIKIGNEIFMVGTPFGLGHTLSMGRISGKHKPKNLLTEIDDMELLQIDGSLNYIASGSAIFNMDGEVIAILSNENHPKTNTPIGFGLPVNAIKNLILSEDSFWTGIDVYFLTDELAGIFNLPQQAGLLVQRISVESPVAEIGLLPGFLHINMEGEELFVGGDIILEINDTPVSPNMNFINIFKSSLQELQQGNSCKLTVLRHGDITVLSTEE